MSPCRQGRRLSNSSYRRVSENFINSDKCSYFNSDQGACEFPRSLSQVDESVSMRRVGEEGVVDETTPLGLMSSYLRRTSPLTDLWWP